MRRASPEDPDTDNRGPLFTHAIAQQLDPEHLRDNFSPSELPGSDPDMLRAAFLRFHADNPQVWNLYERFALQAIAKGRGRFSSKAIFERLRWYANFETVGEVFKVNNSYTAYYARHFVEKFPQYADFFEMREVKS